MPATKTRSKFVGIAENCLVGRIRALSREITQIYDGGLRPYGLKASQMSILVGVGVRGPIQPERVCAALHLEKSTLSRAVSRMAANGWIQVDEARDGRGQELRLTRAGRDLLTRVRPAWDKAQKQAGKQLGPDLTRALVANVL